MFPRSGIGVDRESHAENTGRSRSVPDAVVELGVFVRRLFASLFTHGTFIKLKVLLLSSEGKCVGERELWPAPLEDETEA